MASEEHLALSEQVKQVHLSFRTRSQEVGAETAWQEHLKQTDTLKKYAAAMKDLAEEHWAKKNQGDRKSLCRIQWIVETLQEYFFDGGLEIEIQKEKSRLKLSEAENLPPIKETLQILDVGSCYNPFKKYTLFKTFAIDLYPAEEDVKQCDFLELELQNDFPEDWFTDKVVCLPVDYFDAVVFCLVLEYLPSPQQRLKACEKAWGSLRLGGVLVIVTPDSSHESAHSKLMKEWNMALIRIGFVRFRLEKLKYLYCMAFRKTRYREKYLSLGRYQCEAEPQIFIPQDFVNYGSQL